MSYIVYCDTELLYDLVCLPWQRNATCPKISTSTWYCCMTCIIYCDMKVLYNLHHLLWQRIATWFKPSTLIWSTVYCDIKVLHNLYHLPWQRIATWSLSIRPEVDFTTWLYPLPRDNFRTFQWYYVSLGRNSIWSFCLCWDRSPTFSKQRPIRRNCHLVYDSCHETETFWASESHFKVYERNKISVRTNGED